MGCSSCGQKYRGLNRMRGSSRRIITNRGARVLPNPTIAEDQPPVTVQPDTSAAIAPGPLAEPQMPSTEYTLSASVTSKEYAIDPTTGLPVSQLTTGSCPENMLGDTAPQPVNLESMDIPGSKNDVG